MILLGAMLGQVGPFPWNFKWLSQILLIRILLLFKPLVLLSHTSDNPHVSIYCKREIYKGNGIIGFTYGQRD